MSHPSSSALKPDDVAQVCRAPLFRTLAPDGQRDVAASARVVSLKRGQVLFRQGERADAVFLVLSGRVKVVEVGAEGFGVVLRLDGQGEALGLLAALGEAVYPVTAEVSEPCRAAQWSGAGLQQLMQRHPGIALAALPLVLARLRAAQDQFRELATERVEQRIARVVVRLVQRAGRKTPDGVLVDAPLTRQDLAEMVGTTLYTVSRVLSRWASEGVLVSRGRRLLITRPQELVRLAEGSGPGHPPRR